MTSSSLSISILSDLLKSSIGKLYIASKACARSILRFKLWFLLSICFPLLPLWSTHHYGGEMKLTMWRVFGLLANLEEEGDNPPPITMDHYEATCNVYGKVHPLSLKMGARSCCICYCRNMGSRRCQGCLWALWFSCKPWWTKGRWDHNWKLTCLIWLLFTFLNMTTMIVVMALLLRVQNYLMLVKHHGC